MSSVLLSVWFTIQGIFQNTTCSVWFRIQRLVDYLFKIRPASSGSGFSVLIKNVQGIIQRLVHDSGIIQNTTCSIWFWIQRIIKKCPGFYSASGSRFRVLFKIRPAASGSGFSVLLKNVQGIIQRLVHDSGYYSKYDLQHLVQDSAYYQKMSSVLLQTIQGIIQNTTCSVWFRIQRIIKKCPGYYSASGSLFRVLFKI